MVIHLTSDLKRKKPCSEAEKHSFIQPHRLPMGDAAGLEPGPDGRARHITGMSGDMTNYGLWQVTGALGAESPSRTVSSFRLSVTQGVLPTPEWLPGTCVVILYRDTSATSHATVRSPRRCLDSFNATIFLLMPSTIKRGIWNSRFTEQEKPSIAKGPKK